MLVILTQFETQVQSMPLKLAPVFLSQVDSARAEPLEPGTTRAIRHLLCGNLSLFIGFSLDTLVLDQILMWMLLEMEIK